MTDTAQRIMGLFLAHGIIEPGAVLIISELRRKAADWGMPHPASLEAAMEELKAEGYVIITAPHGLELTERGVSYLLQE
jgi:hypothetical protein